MRKFAVIGVVLALLAGGTAAMSIASASAAPKPAAADSVKVLHLISRQTSLRVVDVGKKGISPGDEVIETTADFQHGMRVDRSVLTCVLMTAARPATETRSDSQAAIGWLDARARGAG